MDHAANSTPLPNHVDYSVAKLVLSNRSILHVLISSDGLCCQRLPLIPMASRCHVSNISGLRLGLLKGQAIFQVAAYLIGRLVMELRRRSIDMDMTKRFAIRNRWMIV
jgi:hypothetical protein